MFVWIASFLAMTAIPIVIARNEAIKNIKRSNPEYNMNNASSIKQWKKKI